MRETLKRWKEGRRDKAETTKEKQKNGREN